MDPERRNRRGRTRPRGTDPSVSMGNPSAVDSRTRERSRQRAGQPVSTLHFCCDAVAVEELETLTDRELKQKRREKSYQSDA
jgi:hypothetical protein